MFESEFDSQNQQNLLVTNLPDATAEYLFIDCLRGLFGILPTAQVPTIPHCRVVPLGAYISGSQTTSV